MTHTTHLIYAGGTFGSHGTPLAPLPADVFLPALTERMSDAGYSVQVLANGVVKDSSTLDTSDLVAFYHTIITAYADGVRQIVLITGTDTLSFLTAFLANALADLIDLSVVVTGSMAPLFVPTAADYTIDKSSDAWANLSAALDVACDGTAGVSVQFAGKLMDGTNTQKINSQVHDAFTGTPASRLPRIVCDINITDRLAALDKFDKKAAHTQITAIYCLPNDTANINHQLTHLHQDTVAVILIGFGVGNLPSSPQIIATIGALTAQGIPVISTTMCPFGGTNSDYAAGSWQYAHGVWAAGSLSIAGIYGQALWLSLTDKLSTDHWKYPIH